MFTPIRETLIQWQDREFPRPVAGMAVVDRQGRLALVYSSYGGQGWHFPKGGIDENESPAEAALKELAEEAGLVAKTSGQTSFPVPGGNFIQSLGFGSPRIQPKNLIHHPSCDYFGKPFQITSGPPITGQISMGALMALDEAAKKHGMQKKALMEQRYTLFDACHDVRVTWRQKPVYLVASFLQFNPSLLTGETEAVRWWKVEELTGPESIAHRHVRELLAQPEFLDLVSTAKKESEQSHS